MSRVVYVLDCIMRCEVTKYTNHKADNGNCLEIHRMPSVFLKQSTSVSMQVARLPPFLDDKAVQAGLKIQLGTCWYIHVLPAFASIM